MATKGSILVVRSITGAMKGQKILESNGIAAYVQRNMSPNSRVGCGYVLKINGNPQTAVMLLARAGVPVVEVMGG